MGTTPLGAVPRRGRLCSLGHLWEGSSGNEGKGAAGILATRCHQEPTRQKKGSGEGPEPLVPSGVPNPLGRRCSLVSRCLSLHLLCQASGGDCSVQEEIVSTDTTLPLPPAHTNPG